MQEWTVHRHGHGAKSFKTYREASEYLDKQVTKRKNEPDTVRLELLSPFDDAICTILTGGGVHMKQDYMWQ